MPTVREKLINKHVYANYEEIVANTAGLFDNNKIGWNETMLSVAFSCACNDVGSNIQFAHLLPLFLDQNCSQQRW